MRRRNVIALVAVVAVAAVSALAGVAQGDGSRATITVGNNFLSPSSKTIDAGTKLRFKWLGGELHHIVKTKGPGGEIKSPATSKKGVHLSKVIVKRGTYRFICTFHPTEMKLKLVVR